MLQTFTEDYSKMGWCWEAGTANVPTTTTTTTTTTSNINTPLPTGGIVCEKSRIFREDSFLFNRHKSATLLPTTLYSGLHHHYFYLSTKLPQNESTTII